MGEHYPLVGSMEKRPYEDACLFLGRGPNNLGIDSMATTIWPLGRGQKASKLKAPSLSSH